MEAGYDVRAGRYRVGPLMQRWLQERRGSVTAKTLRVDEATVTKMSVEIASLQVGKVAAQHVERRTKLCSMTDWHDRRWCERGRA